MSRMILRGGRVIDPASNTDATLDILIDAGIITAIGGAIDATDATEIDVSGLVVAPGLVDIHVHLREPGREDEETIESGTRAAVHGGVTRMAAMPNTEPAIDDPSWVEYVRVRGTLATVHPIAAITMQREGKVLTGMAELAAAGAVAFSDDGCSVESANVMRRALEYASMTGRPVVAHCEDPALVGHGVMHEGLASTQAGLRPIPPAAEEVMVARDIILAADTGARLHIAHVSTAGSVELVRRAKADGIAVTCETCPHYFSLTDDDVRSYDTSLRVNPPLRTAADVAAIIDGLVDGTIDAIASDHAPHALEEKQVEFDAAPPGMIGLETLLPVTLTYLVHPGAMTLQSALGLLTSGPARALGIPGGTLEIGARADVVVFDPDTEWTLGADWFRSKSKNSPYVGRPLRGRVRMTITHGRVVFEEEDHDKGRPGDDCGSVNAERNELAVNV